MAEPREKEARQVRTETAKTFTGRVVIDERAFVDCTFEGATLLYFGGPPPSFRGCQFRGAQWDFKSSALNTIGLLQAFSRPESGFRPLFEQIFASPAGPGGDGPATP
jgi:hypothetical protein